MVSLTAKMSACWAAGKGVFAAIRAARLGAKVPIVERQNYFGGTATAGLVNIWHSMFDFDYKEQVIAGLSDEVIKTLVQGAMRDHPE